MKEGYKDKVKVRYTDGGVLCRYCSYSSIIHFVSVDLTGVLELTQLAKCSIENNLLISFSWIFISRRSLAMRKIDHLLDVKR